MTDGSTVLGLVPGENAAVTKVTTRPSETVLTRISSFDELSTVEAALESQGFDVTEEIDILVKMARNTDGVKPKDRLDALEALEKRRIQALRMSGRLATMTEKIVSRELSAAEANEMREVVQSIQRTAEVVLPARKETAHAGTSIPSSTTRPDSMPSV